MKNYKKFTNYKLLYKIFDELQDKSKYKKWARFIEQVWVKLNFKPKSLIDLGCGSGSSFMPFVKSMKIAGLDSSTEMLKIARKRLKGIDHKVKLFKQSFLDIDLKDKFDAAICLNFTVVHIYKKKDFGEFFKNIYKILNPGGIFVFDIKPRKAFLNIFNKRAEFHKLNGSEYKWEVKQYRSDPNLFKVIFYLKQGEDILKETNINRVYALKDIKKYIAESGFKLMGVYDNYDFEKPSLNSKMWVFVLKK